MPIKRGVGDLLAESGDLTVRRLSRASTWQKTHGGTIERALLSTGAVTEETLTNALAQAYGLPGVARATLMAADPDVVDCLPAKERRRLRALPFSVSGGKILNVAISDPQNLVLQKNVAVATGFSVELFVAPDPVLEDAIERFEAPRAAGATPAPAPAAGVPAPGPATPPPAPAPRPTVKHPFPTTASGSAEAWLDRLGRALLAEALRNDATEVELGSDAQGAFLRTFDAANPAVTRRLSVALLAPLVAWFRNRCRRAEGFVVDGVGPDEAPRRRRVDLLAADERSVRVRLVPVDQGVELPKPARVDVTCEHERAEGFVFCPRCGVVL